MGKKNGLPWFKVRPDNIKTVERRASGEAVKKGLFAAISYFESGGEVEPKISDIAAGMVFDAFRLGIDELLRERKRKSDGGKNSAAVRAERATEDT